MTWQDGAIAFLLAAVLIALYLVGARIGLGVVTVVLGIVGVIAVVVAVRQVRSDG
ncbi:MAG: hypothetical protein NVSMB52_16590 [Chloroflexota bacterium]